MKPSIKRSKGDEQTRRQVAKVVDILTSNMRTILAYDPPLSEVLDKVPGVQDGVAPTGMQLVQFDTMSMAIDETMGTIFSQSIFELKLVERLNYVPNYENLEKFVEYFTKQGIRELRLLMPDNWYELDHRKLDLTKWALEDEEWEILSSLFQTNLLETIVFDVDDRLLPTQSTIFCNNLMSLNKKKIVLSEKVRSTEHVFCEVPSNSKWTIGTLEVANVHSVGGNRWTEVTEKLLLNLFSKHEPIMYEYSHARSSDFSSEEAARKNRTENFWKHLESLCEQQTERKKILFTIRISIPQAPRYNPGHIFGRTGNLFIDYGHVEKIVQLSKWILDMRFDFATEIQSTTVFGPLQTVSQPSVPLYRFFREWSVSQKFKMPCLMFRLLQPSGENHRLEEIIPHMGEHFSKLFIGIIFPEPSEEKDTAEHVFHVLDRCFPNKYHRKNPYIQPPSNPVRCAVGVSRWMMGSSHIETLVGDEIKKGLERTFKQDKLKRWKVEFPETEQDGRLKCLEEPMWDEDPNSNSVELRTEEEKFLEYPKKWLPFILRDSGWDPTRA